MIRHIHTLTLIVTMAACAGTPRARLTTIDVSDYPSERFFCYVGVGAGEDGGQQLAEQRARQGVVTQVASTIQSELAISVREESVNREGLLHSSIETTARSNVVQTGNYDRAELIRVMDSYSGRREHRVLACLDRYEAAKVELDEVAPQLQRHHEAYVRAKAFANVSNIGAFAAALSEAKQVERVARPRLDKARVFLGEMAPEDHQLRSELEELIELSAALRTDITLEVVSSAGSAPEGAQAVQQSLARLGFQASLSDVSSCGRGHGSYSFVVGYEDGCPSRRSITGMWICSPELRLVVRDCEAGTQILDTVIWDRQLGGAGSSLEAARKQSLTEKLNTPRLDPFVSEALSGVFPTP